MAAYYYWFSRRLTITAGVNDSLVFTETGTGNLTATIAAGDYFLTGNEYSIGFGDGCILEAIASAMTTISASSGASRTYAVTRGSELNIGNNWTGPFRDQHVTATPFGNGTAPRAYAKFAWEITTSASTFNFVTSGTTFPTELISINQETAKAYYCVDTTDIVPMVWTPSEPPSADDVFTSSFDVSQSITRNGSAVTFKRGGPYFTRTVSFENLRGGEIYSNVWKKNNTLMGFAEYNIGQPIAVFSATLRNDGAGNEGYFLATDVGFSMPVKMATDDSNNPTDYLWTFSDSMLSGMSARRFSPGLDRYSVDIQMIKWGAP